MQRAADSRGVQVHQLHLRSMLRTATERLASRWMYQVWEPRLWHAVA